VIADPSHAAGASDLVPALARIAVAAGADGLLVEVHPNPAKAWSDGDQSLDFPAFDSMMEMIDPYVTLRSLAMAAQARSARELPAREAEAERVMEAVG
jgi:3-deoxy-7-phosphoheptulonate synthase